MGRFLKSQFFRNGTNRQVRMGEQALGFQINAFGNNYLRAHANCQSGGAGQAFFGAAELSRVVAELVPLGVVLFNQFLKALEALRRGRIPRLLCLTLAMNNGQPARKGIKLVPQQCLNIGSKIACGVGILGLQTADRSAEWNAPHD